MTFLNYLNSRKCLLFLVFLYCFINLTVLFLYGCNTEPVLYAFIIFLVLFIIFGIWDYLHQLKKHKLLTSYDKMTGKPLQELVTEKSVLAKDYQNIIIKLEQEQMLADSNHLQKVKNLSDFYTMWVHQIKTPIAALRLLLQTSPDHIFAMKNELFKIEQYVDIILGYMRMDDMNQDLMLKHYSLEDMVKQAVKKYSSLFIQSKLSIKMEQLSVDVLTDEKWMVLVIEQLLSNAIKYTTEGGIHIHAQTCREGSLVKSKLMIEDTGNGIAAEDLPRIFERAFTGYNGRMDKKSSGLGLYLCKTILDKLGHNIAIRSVPREGTCVTITFVEDVSL